MDRTRTLLAVVALFATGIARADNDAVFVSAAGNDRASGLTESAPVRTIAAGIQRAQAAGRHRVYVTVGVFTAFVMANGVDVQGGIAQNFVGYSPASSGLVTEIRGGYFPTLGYDAVVVADAITTPTQLVGVRLQQAVPQPGRNSVGLVIRAGSSGFVADNLQIVGAQLPSALAGASGSNASQTPAAAGAPGASAVAQNFCNDSVTRAGGGGGANAAAGPGASGATGGAGGRQSSNCSSFPPNLTPTAGQAGASTADAAGGAGGPADSTTPGQPGSSFAPPVVDGAHGARGGSGFVLVNGSPTRAPGGAGILGTPGRGGSGGGGGGGIRAHGAGAGGGGGGAGGARAPVPGNPGQAGGNSIGILVQGSNATIRNATIVRGNGGAGGTGGSGGRGQPGGAGGAGGTGLDPPMATGIRGAGGAGGAGSRGGNSGAGAGGAGGHSIGILRDALSTVATESVTYSGGAGGAGGAAGQVHSGTGQAGLPGQVFDQRTY